MTGAGSRLPMFPLGSVLFPHMPLLLNVFEPRYRQLLADCLAADPSEFGVVLIERGFEVGGGDVRFNLGTTAEVLQAAQLAPGLFRVVARGTTRLRITEWLPDDPYPVATVERLPDAAFEGGSDLGDAERLVRRALAMRQELGDPSMWSPAVELEDDPTVATWQLAAIAPLGEIDQLELLGQPSLSALLDRLVELVSDECEALAFRLSGG